MRQITANAVNAFMNDSKFSSGNTTVTIDETDVFLSLHGHKIARKEVGEREIRINSAGWETNTTKERLNGLPGVNIHQKNYVWYLNGEVWENSHEWKSI